MIKHMLETMLSQMDTLAHCGMGDLEREQARRFQCAVTLVRSVVNELETNSPSPRQQWR